MSELQEKSFEKVGLEYLETLKEILVIIKRAKSRQLEEQQLKIMINRQFVGVLEKYNLMVRAYCHDDTDIMFDIVSESAETLRSMLSHLPRSKTDSIVYLKIISQFNMTVNLMITRKSDHHNGKFEIEWEEIKGSTCKIYSGWCSFNDQYLLSLYLVYDLFLV